MKVCVHCSRDLPLYAFTRDKSRPDGLFPWCAECKSKNRRAAYAATHPDRRTVDVPASTMVYKTKVCIDCCEEKNVGEFHRKRSAVDKLTPYCKVCGSARSVAWERKNKERATSRRLAWRQSSPRQSLNVTLRGALARKPTENPATLQDLMNLWGEQEGCCAVTGIKMTWAQGKLLPTSITLDRIDPTAGYTISNIRLLCHAVNAFKGQMNDDEMFNMALAIVANMKKPKLRLVS